MNAGDVSVQRSPIRARGAHDSGSWLSLARVAGIATLVGAAAIHVRVMPQHFEEWWAGGLTFAVLVVAEAGLAVAIVMTPSRPWYLAAIWVSQVTIGLWVLSRTVGLPFGPEPFTPEAVGRADLVATTLEAITWAAFTPLFLRRSRPVRTRSMKLPTLVVFLLVGAATIYGVIASPAEHGTGQGHESPTGPIVPVDGHSMLSRYTPAASAQVHTTIGLVVGELTNASADDVAVTEARLLEPIDGGVVRAVRFWVVGPGAAHPGMPIPLSVLHRLGIPLPGVVPVEPYARTGARAFLVLELDTLMPGDVLLSALRITYDDDGRTYDSPYATYARMVVRQEVPNEK